MFTMNLRMEEYMKGIVLAGGKGTRLYPITRAVNKHLLPIYNKPMIYYPISTLMSLGIEDILVISQRDQIGLFKRILKDGRDMGLNLSYEVQDHENGIPEAFIIGESFIGGDNVALILGDNFFYGENIRSVVGDLTRPSLFLYKVEDPERFGVCEIQNGRILSIEEKPSNPKSNYAVTGLYVYDSDVSYYSNSLRKSSRGELEITDLNNLYIKGGNMSYKILDHNMTWFDMGTFESFYKASTFVRDIYIRNGIDICNFHKGGNCYV